MNPKFYQAYAIAKAITRCHTPEAKRRALLAWCVAAKKAIRGW